MKRRSEFFFLIVLAACPAFAMDRCLPLVNLLLSADVDPAKFFNPVRNGRRFKKFHTDRGLRTVFEGAYDCADSQRPPMVRQVVCFETGVPIDDSATLLYSRVLSLLNTVQSEAVRAELLIAFLSRDQKINGLSYPIVNASQLPELLASYLKSIAAKDADLAFRLFLKAGNYPRGRRGLAQLSELESRRPSILALIQSGRLSKDLSEFKWGDGNYLQRVVDALSQNGSIERIESAVENNGPLVLARTAPRTFLSRYVTDAQGFAQLFAFYKNSPELLIQAIDAELARDHNAAGPLSLLVETPGFQAAVGAAYHKFVSDRPAISSLMHPIK